MSKRRRLDEAAPAGKRQETHSSHSLPAHATSSLALAPRARLPSVGALDRPCVDAFIVGELAQLWMRSATLLCGPRAEALASKGEVAFVEVSLQCYGTFAALCRSLQHGWAAAGAAQREWSARTAAAAANSEVEPTRAAAWQLLPLGGDEPVEEVLRQLRDVLSVGERLRAGVRDCEATVAGGLRNLDPVYAEVAEEFAQALRSGLAFAHAALLLLAQLRAGACFADYEAAGQALLSQAERFAGTAEEAYVQRAAWSARVLRAGVTARRYLSEQGQATFLRGEERIRTLVGTALESASHAADAAA